MQPEDSIRVLPSVLPQLRKWVADTVSAWHDHSLSALSVAGPALRACFGREFLERSRVVLIDTVPVPPTHEFGLADLSSLVEGPLDGIALGGTYFVRRAADRPDLHFHELVHVAQWQRLGTDNFLLAYAVGVALHGYHASPLEALASNLQREFLEGIRRLRLLADIDQRTDAIWTDARRHLQAVAVNATHSIHSDWITGRRQ